MTEAKGGCRTGLKFGCFGCLGLLILLIVAAAIMFGIAWNQARNEEIETQELTQVLGAPTPPVGIEGMPIDFVVPKPAGTIALDLRHTGFDIEPAPPGQPLAVEAKFDADRYGLTHSFDEGAENEGWTYELSFQRSSASYLLTALKELLGGTKPRVKILLPRDVPFDLDLDVMQGGAEVELGGLWLTNADIRFLQGGGAIEISEPLPEPVDSLRIQFGQGGGAVEGVANASPGTLDVSFSMGGGYLDLRGPWRRDADISIDQSMGGVTVHLPRNAELRGVGRFDTEAPEEGGKEMPVLSFSTSSRYGELEFIQ